MRKRSLKHQFDAAGVGGVVGAAELLLLEVERDSRALLAGMVCVTVLRVMRVIYSRYGVAGSLYLLKGLLLSECGVGALIILAIAEAPLLQG
jgi:hypothetical protein